MVGGRGTPSGDRPCPACTHPRSSHSKNGCEDWDDKKNEPCKCKQKFTGPN